uniref:D-isomer specific 2-hydroxyacid dehydrogenase catalytic domain-containing protein n=1 Tax=candidate division WOR-3 bacterium TaxID=2052148 RepID=A0A7V3KPT6_UNCW3
MTLKVLFTLRSFSKASPELLEVLKINRCEPIFQTNPDLKFKNDQALAKLIGDADGVIVGDYRLTDFVFPHCPWLKVASKHGVGVDGIEIAKAKEPRMRVTRAGGGKL